MPASRALRRLLRVRELEEDQSRIALESGLAELNRLQNALTITNQRDRRGRQLVAASAQSGELPDRLAGLEEMRSAVRMAEFLAGKIVAAEGKVTELRESFLSTRVQRRQAESLIEETERKDAVEANRRAQQALDDWHRSRRPGANEPRSPKR